MSSQRQLGLVDSRNAAPRPTLQAGQPLWLQHWPSSGGADPRVTAFRERVLPRSAGRRFFVDIQLLGEHLLNTPAIPGEASTIKM